jgi:hypothetical protein
VNPHTPAHAGIIVSALEYVETLNAGPPFDKLTAPGPPLTFKSLLRSVIRRSISYTLSDRSGPPHAARRK